MKRLILSVLLSFAVFGAGLVAGRDATILDEIQVVQAQTCSATDTVNIAIGCGSPGWSVIAQVTHCPTNVPMSVAANVLDSGNNIIEVIPLTFAGAASGTAWGTVSIPRLGCESSSRPWAEQSLSEAAQRTTRTAAPARLHDLASTHRAPW
jgi:hypothetical protein